MIKAREFHAEDLASNPTPDILIKCELFLRKESKTVGPEMNLLVLKISLIKIK